MELICSYSGTPDNIRLSTQNGIFSSTPRPYELSTEYLWILSSTDTDIEGYFSYFDVEYTAGCNWDHLSIVVDGQPIPMLKNYTNFKPVFLKPVFLQLLLDSV